MQTKAMTQSILTGMLYCLAGSVLAGLLTQCWSIDSCGAATESASVMSP